MDTDQFNKFIADSMAAMPAERKIIRKLFKALNDAGNPIVAVWDGEEETKVSTLDSINREAFNLDQLHLYTKSDDWVFIVMGEGWDALTDYTVDLEDAIKPVTDYIEKNAD